MRYIIFGIDYDEGHDDLPKEIAVDITEPLDDEELDQRLSDHISNETGFCHKGFQYRVEPKNTCPHCLANLSLTDSVTREYVNKDGDSEASSVYAHGHYDQQGTFESDRFDGFGGGRFDLLDDSDSCSSCDQSL